MKDRRFAVILLLIGALLLASCQVDFIEKTGETEGMAKVADDLTVNTVSQSPETIFVFTNLSHMRETIPAVDGAIVMLSGYYQAGDGGKGMFYWDSSETVADNGGTVIAPTGTEVGRYVRVCESNTVNVKWFGAQGDGSHDDTAAIQAAIDSLPNEGGTVVLPGGRYKVTDTLHIGNGTADKASDKNGICLVGQGAAFGHEVTDETTLVASAKYDTMLSINGPITDVTIKGIRLNGLANVNTLLYMTDIVQCELSYVSGINFMGTGVIYTAQAPEFGGSHDNIIRSVNFVNVHENTTVFSLGGNYEKGALVYDTVFEDSRFEPHTFPNCVTLDIRYAEGLTFKRCHISAYSEVSTSLWLNALENDGYPRQNSFYDCTVASPRVLEDETHTIGYHFFLGHGTYDLEDPFAGNEHVFGLTDIGSIIRYDG